MLALSASLSVEIVRRHHAARKIAESAGQVLLQFYGRLGAFDTKANDVDLVTIADTESEAWIAGRLQASFPNDLLVMEEADGRDGAASRRAAIQAADLAWCVDPLDGTTNFVHGYPAFAVSIGLLHKGQPVMGVVHAPARKETFSGGLGIGATLNVAPIRVSRTATLARSLVATGFPYDRRGRLEGLLATVRKVLLETHGLRRAGAAALDLCDVACGRLDGYYEYGLSPWDLAAGHAIIEAAGGRVTGRSGDPHDVFAGETIASNGLIHEDFRALVGT